MMKETYQTDLLAAQATNIDEKASTLTTTRVDRLWIALALLSLYLIWGATYLGMRLALISFPAFIMAGIRFLIAGGCMYVVLRVRGTPAPNRTQWLGSALVGILLLAGGNGGVAFAEQWVATGISAVGIAAVTLWAALAFGLMGRWPTRIEWCGLGLGFAGVLLLNLENGLWTNPLGAISLLLAPMCWALGSALSTRVTMPSGLMASAAQMLIGGSILLIGGLLLGERVHGLPTIQALEAMAFLVIFGSFIAFSAYGYLLRRVRPALATSYAYVNPVVAVVLGIGFDGEHITVVGLLAMLIILTGVGLVSLTRKHP